MKRAIIVIAVVCLLTACAQQMYWNRPGVSIEKTSKDLLACRMEGAKANQGGHIIYSAQEIESPCMVAKGYELSATPPQK